MDYYSVFFTLGIGVYGVKIGVRRMPMRRSEEDVNTEIGNRPACPHQCITGGCPMCLDAHLKVLTRPVCSVPYFQEQRCLAQIVQFIGGEG